MDENEYISIKVKDFESKYVSRASYDALRAELEQAREAITRLLEFFDQSSLVHMDYCSSLDGGRCDCGYKEDTDFAKNVLRLRACAADAKEDHS